ncbi:hypothetical protein BDB01DRAFT_779859 [Pilobolus umbonatus]|nr:hypothetical protein BDB01DRAFT_779859 [Pilobolus umbonatus]
MDESDNNYNNESEAAERLSFSSNRGHREVSVYAKLGTFDPNSSLIGTRKRATSSPGNPILPSFTQRLIERGVAVPTSFPTLDKNRPSEDSSSPASLEFDNYYGMSPFITPSFSHHSDNKQGGSYKSLRERYELERNSVFNTMEEFNKHSHLSEEDEDEEQDVVSSPDTYSTQRKKKHIHAEDSDIELSDEEDHSAQADHLKLLFPSRPYRSRASILFNSQPSEVARPVPDSPIHSDENNPPTLPPEMASLKQLLITKPAVLTIIPTKPKPLPTPPRRHILQTPVFQVINANTFRDRYLFLFNDLLLICKPIMDENIIISSGTPRNSIEKNRYRFRPNENSLFQVKNIVQLSKLTLYIAKDYYYSTTKQPTIEMGPDGKPILPPARKIHPIMASALRKFEINAHLGIQYLIDKGVLTNDPLSIANFLFKTPDLNRRQLGYYLSELKNSDIYDAFLECFRLVGLRLDEALRILLTTFRLPSNWLALEYLIERFAKKWHDANQNVIKFHEDMVVKVVVAMLFLNAEWWYDATSERDVFWYARELKERQDRQAKRKMSVIDYSRKMAPALSKTSTSATTSSLSNLSQRIGNNNRQSVSVEPLHYIMSTRKRSASQPTLEEFLHRWDYYDQYHLVPHEFMEEMYKSIGQERLETGWDNKTGRRNPGQPALDGDGVERPKVVSPSVNQGSQDVVITVIPHRLPTRLTKGIPSDPITISIPASDPGLQIKLRGQDLVFEPNILDFSHSCIQTFRITGNTLGRTSLMFIKSGENAGNYVSPTLPRTKSVVVERPFMRYTFQIGFKQLDNRREVDEKRKLDLNEDTVDSKGKKKKKVLSPKSVQKKEMMRALVNRANTDGILSQDEEEDGRRTKLTTEKYTFSVETEEERVQWIDALKKLSGQVNDVKNETNISRMDNMSFESQVAFQVLKEDLLTDEVRKGTARTLAGGTNMHGTNGNNGNNGKGNVVESSNISNMSNNGGPITVNGSTNNASNTYMQSYNERHGQAMKLLLPKKEASGEDRNLSHTSTTANVVTKRGHEIVKLVIQNSNVPLILDFLKSQINQV